MWSLVIAKDLFSAFDPADLFAPEVAHRYRDRVLARGGSRDAADLVDDFLGRPYAFDAFAAWLTAPPSRFRSPERDHHACRRPGGSRVGGKSRSMSGWRGR